VVFIYFLYVLLAMSVTISVFGIASLVFRSIHERTREFGLLLPARRGARLQVLEAMRAE
jgi:ABC-type lipoprotein release transport system permease subunit